MATTPLLDTSTITLGDLFSNGKIYKIPPFQRDYSWVTEQCEDIWTDLTELRESRQPHYMGAIVLQEKDDSVIVIDGQQRMATLSILIIALLRKIKELKDSGIEPEKNEERYNLLYSQYIGAKDPASLKYSSKLYLNKNDDGFYQGYLVNYGTPHNIRKLSDSERRLWDAYEFYRKKIDEKYKDERKGEVIAEFIKDIIGKRLIFIRIFVQDELGAYTVFETLNARGLELTATDLLKNYLFSLVADSETDMSHVERKWKDITGNVGMDVFPEFLRHYLNSKQPNVRAERLFKAIKSQITTKDHVFSLLEKLEKAAVWYKALSDPYDELWGDCPECKTHVRHLNLFKVKQYKPLILACIATDKDNTFLGGVLRTIVVISFRFNIIARKSTHQLEETYNKVAMEISENGIQTEREIKKGLMPIYIRDEDFKNAFETIDISRKSKLTKYILCSLEKHLSEQDLDFETASATIEHVLPENPGDEWQEFSEEDRERFLYRLGNMTLLEKKLNQEVANKPYEEKQPVYERSQYTMTKNIDFHSWTQAAILERQKNMSGWALTVWRIDI
jgi:hypothetical protein